MTATDIDMPSQPTLSVIIITLERPDDVQTAVNALLTQSVTPDELIVVDQSAEPGSYPDSVTVLTAPPLGPSAARNLGARHATADLLLFIDDDVDIVSNSFIANHVRWYAHEFIDVVHGAVQQEGTPLPEVPDVPELDNAVERLVRSPNCQRRQPCIGLAGGNVSIRRSRFAHLGGFDERFTRHEDIEFGIRLYRSGALTLFDPDARVVHLRRPTGGTRTQLAMGLWRPQPHPSAHLLYLIHFPGWQARCHALQRLGMTWHWRRWCNPFRCIVKTIRLWRCIRHAQQLSREPFSNSHFCDSAIKHSLSGQ